MLLAETYPTNKNNFQVPGYFFYSTSHPDGKAHDGIGILIRNRIRHHFPSELATNYLQPTSINLQKEGQNITVAVVHCPPRFTITEAQFMNFFNTLVEHFIAAGDYNATQNHWGPRLETPKRRPLYKAIIKVGFTHILINRSQKTARLD